MKKVVCLILCMFVVMISGIVLADSGGPAFYQYEAVVTNPNGTTIYGSKYEDDKFILYENGKLEYGDVITISYISEFDNAEYASTWDNNLKTNNGEEYGYVLFKDLKKKTPWDMSEFSFYDFENDGTIIKENGADIYEWPSKVEKVIGMIPNKTVIKYKMSWQEGHWVYVTYNGISGWVNINCVGIKNENAQLMGTITGTPILDANDNKIGEIPAGEIVNGYYYFEFTDTYYITYNGIEGYVKYSDVVNIYSDKNLKYTVNYDDAVLIGTDYEIVSVPKGSILEFSFSYWPYLKEINTSVNQIYTNYNGKEGWIILFEEYDYSDNEEYNREQTQKRLDNVMKATEYLKTFAENKKNNSGETIEISNVQEETKEPAEAVTTIPEENTHAIKNINVITSNSPTKLAIVCVLGTLSISLLAAVFIILLNDNSSKKSLYILIPIAIIVTSLALYYMREINTQTVEIETVENTISNDKDVTTPEEIPVQKEIAKLKTSFTKNFFDLGEYGSVTYKNDGKQFGFMEAYRSEDVNWKYNKEIVFDGEISASSTLDPQGEFSYGVEHIVNGNRSNTWIEGADGFGIGEYVEMKLTNKTSSNRKYKNICIVNGYAETMKKWENNSRVKSLKLYHNNELVATIDLLDMITPQYIDISSLNIESKAGSTETFRFEIAEVYEEEYPGTRYSDTAITGIMFGY